MGARAHHNAWFDWLRFLAALEVVVTHGRTIMFVEYSQLDQASHNLLTLAWVGVTRQGYEAVMLFFVLSGYLVGGPAFSRALAGTFQPREYALDRFVRIMVPLVPAVALALLAEHWLGRSVSMIEGLGCVLSLQGVLTGIPYTNPALWSLSYEVWFYILAGAVASLIARLHGSRAISLVLVVCAALVFMRLDVIYLLIWLAGSAAYLLRPAKATRLGIVGAVLLMLIGVAIHQMSLPNSMAPGALEGHRLGQVTGKVVMATGMAILLAQLSCVQTNAAGLFSRVGASLAGFSYSLYLTHMPLLYMQAQQDATRVTIWTFGAYVLAVTEAILFAYLFSRLFEATGPWIKNRFRAAIQHGPSSATIAP
jgi:peptidoglycan/LPS O-acetylase OafA/YrhL